MVGVIAFVDIFGVAELLEIVSQNTRSIIDLLGIAKLPHTRFLLHGVCLVLGVIVIYFFVRACCVEPVRDLVGDTDPVNTFPLGVETKVTIDPAVGTIFWVIDMFVGTIAMFVRANTFVLLFFNIILFTRKGAVAETNARTVTIARTRVTIAHTNTTS